MGCWRCSRYCGAMLNVKSPEAPAASTVAAVVHRLAVVPTNAVMVLVRPVGRRPPDVLRRVLRYVQRARRPADGHRGLFGQREVVVPPPAILVVGLAVGVVPRPGVLRRRVKIGASSRDQRGFRHVGQVDGSHNGGNDVGWVFRSHRYLVGLLVLVVVADTLNRGQFPVAALMAREPAPIPESE